MMNNKLQDYLNQYPAVASTILAQFEEAERAPTRFEYELIFEDDKQEYIAGLQRRGYEYFAPTIIGPDIYIRLIPRVIFGHELPVTEADKRALADWIAEVDTETYEYWGGPEHSKANGRWERIDSHVDGDWAIARRKKKK